MDLHNRIYNAINEGLLKTLKIDDDNIHIDYQRNNISNDMNIMQYYISEIFKGNDIKENYDNIIKCHQANNTVYFKPDNFKQLSYLYDKIKYIDGWKQPITVDWIDFTNTIKIILEDNTEIPLHLYEDNMNALFIKIYNTECNHDLILHKDLLKKKVLWIKDKDILDDYSIDYNIAGCYSKKTFNANYEDIAKKDFNGYMHTYDNHDIMRNRNNDRRDFKNYSAFQYCSELQYNGYIGYLPALGELLFLYRNAYWINYAIQKINGNNFLYINADQIWSSTEYSAKTVWCMYPGKYSLIPGQYSKINNLFDALPLFHKK